VIVYPGIVLTLMSLQTCIIYFCRIQKEMLGRMLTENSNTMKVNENRHH